ncbi:Spermidine/putrescine import ATP-binding protein PotA [Ensifer psoraleae]|uniref:ABC transporter ATP-binding protein n=1 Tax=Sinorhizobium psoraleae TaxID=520838 RepID=UPI001569AA4D|nr:ABC transporter ATP-binding protein [Sinorhizobium psoraleae]NRP72187.1 Spermidine/putrescine import ATP-binding protein PotA [Sinorhizobium psoraleae]
MKQAERIETVTEMTAAAPVDASPEPAKPPHIVVSDLVIKYGAYTAVHGVSFDIPKGEHLTLLGPSGCGKTTTLRSIAGLEHPFSGEILIDGHPVYSSSRRVNVPTEQRGVSMVFQSYAIWPHMTVFENVAYGLRVRKISADAIRVAVEKSLDLVQMRRYADRPASQLSGGQQQRVALARAIAFEPAVVLFDEPLSNLDAKLRGEMRVELKDLQRTLGISSVYVTHDQEEAFAISDRVVIMNEGRIEQIGGPQDIYDRPRNSFVADFVGSANLINGRVDKAASGADHITFRTESGLSLKALSPRPVKGDEAQVAIRTAYIGLGATATSHANRIEGRVARRMFHGDFVQYLIDWPAGQLVVRRPPAELIEEGETVTIAFDAEHCVLLEASTS